MHKLNFHFRHGLSDIQCAKDLSRVKLTSTTLNDMCLSEYYNETLCIGKNLYYRIIDGTCNNLKRSSLGKATSPYKRLLFPAYSDGNIFNYLFVYIFFYKHFNIALLLARYFF